MPSVQIIWVTTAEVGPAGPIKRLFAVGVDEPEAALQAIAGRLKKNETARWLDARFLSLEPGEVRQI